VSVAAPPVRDGAVLISNDGRIEAVGADHDVPRPPNAETREFPKGILLPGLINTHTHLELSFLRGAVRQPEFHRWVAEVRDRKAATPPEAFLASAEEGVRECFASGITTVADCGDSGAVIQTLNRLGGRGFAYHEVFGPDPARAGESMRGLTASLDRLARFETKRVRLGISPHAPYTVSAELFRAAARLAEELDLPLAIHIAESPAESALVQKGEGPFADALRARGIAVEGTGGSPVEFLEQVGALERRPLCVHAVQAGDDDLATLKRWDAPVAHCPRSNAAHGHGAAGVARMRALGLRVGLGSDSVASVPAIDLFAEAREAQKLAGCTAAEAVRWMTLDGARALGMQTAVGSLEVGKRGDACVVEVGVNGSPESSVITHGSPQHVRLTVIEGRPVREG
jgi:cytosine/adenosine deaminase-related metal-dependent hydrolase